MNETDVAIFLLGALAGAFVLYLLRSKRYEKAEIPDELREEIYDRDRWRCRNPFCRSRRDLTIDHKYPERKGGTLRPRNLQTLCRSCNSRKGARIKFPGVPWWAFWLRLEIRRLGR